jgi:hypothetical protein
MPEPISFQESVERHLSNSELEMRQLRQSINKLSTSVDSQTTAINLQTTSVKFLTEAVQHGQQIYATAIPVRLVFYILAILSACILGVESGVKLFEKF